jgi:hypothetical protein
MNRALIVLFLFSLFSGCSDREEKRTLPNSYSHGVITSHTLEEYYLELDSLTLAIDGYQYLDYYYSGDYTYLAAYNLKTHSIDVINLSKGRREWSVTLSQHGPDAVERGIRGGLLWLSPDSILIDDGYSSFCIVNSKGEVIWRLRKDDEILFSELPEGTVFTTDYHFRASIDQAGSGFVVTYYVPGQYNPGDEVKCLAHIDFESKVAKPLPVLRPPYFTRAAMPGMVGPRSFSKGDKLVITLPYSSDIIAYDWHTGEVEKHGGRSRYSPNWVEPRDPKEDLTDYYIRSAQFFGVTYDPFRKLYYRFHWGEFAYTTWREGYNPITDKPVYLTVFDREFNHLYETKIEVDSGIAVLLTFPMPEGLLVFPINHDPADLAMERNKGYLLKVF